RTVKRVLMVLFLIALAALGFASSSQLKSDTETSDGGSSDRRFLERENTAAGVLAVLRNASHAEFRGRCDAYFIDRWIPRPGWNGKVDGFPKPVGGGCNFGFAEDETGARVVVIGGEEACDLRPGDALQLTGKIVGCDRESVTIGGVEYRLARES